MTNIILTNFHFLVPKSYHMKFGRKCPSGFKEKQVLIFICKLMSLGQGQERTLTLNTHISSLSQLVVCIYQHMFRSQAAIVSEKSNVFTFFQFLVPKS